MAATEDAAAEVEASASQSASASASADTLPAYAPLVSAAATPASASSSDLGSASSSAQLPVVEGERRRASGRLGVRRISVAAGECSRRSVGLDDADPSGGGALVSKRTAPLASARELDETDVRHGGASKHVDGLGGALGGASRTPYTDGAPPTGANGRRLQPPRVGVGSSRGLARPPLSGLPRAATGGGSSSRAFARALSSVRLKLHRR